MISRTSGLLCTAILAVAVSCNSNPSTISTVSKKVTVNKGDTVKKAIVKQNTSLPDISGFYKAVPDDEAGVPCELSVKITKLKNEYRYAFNIQDSVLKGKVTLTRNNGADPSACNITFEGIKWASYEGKVAEQDDERSAAKPMVVPVGIEAMLSKREIRFQNYGNAMNSYTVIEGCDPKYIHMVKR